MSGIAAVDEKGKRAVRCPNSWQKILCARHSSCHDPTAAVRPAKAREDEITVPAAAHFRSVNSRRLLITNGRSVAVWSIFEALSSYFPGRPFSQAKS